MLPSPLQTIVNIILEVRQAWIFGDNFRSRLRLASDFILYRVLKAIDLNSRNVERTIQCSGGIFLTYRLNRGDIQGIREVWFDETYRLPFAIEPKLVIDLGANIGLTTVWLSHRYGCEKIIAVEPDLNNALLAEKNIKDNGINGYVVRAAVGAIDGVATFETSGDSNLGTVVASNDLKVGEQIDMVSIATLLKDLPDNQIVDLVKMDIEGGEQQLLLGDLFWLSRTRAMMAEFHPDRVDYAALVNRVVQHGFDYIPHDTVYSIHADAFLSKALGTG
jgi:FkbM family methyltransferase